MLANLDRPLAALDVKQDRHTLDRNHLADEFGEVRDRPAKLSAKDLEEHFLLAGRCLVVDIESNAPIAFEDVARNVADRSDRRPADIDPVDNASIEVVGVD